MNTAIQAALDHAVQSLKAEGTLPSDWNNTSILTRTKDRSHGDFASNIAMIASKAAGMKPRDLADKILANLPEVADISKAEIAGPGFINFFLSRSGFKISFSANTAISVMPNPVATNVIDTVRNLLYNGT